MFATIASRYDRANTVLSAGIHHRWRQRTVRWSEAGPGDHVLDCATGTGDLAIAFSRVVAPNGSVVGTDFVPEMIELARRKSPAVRFQVADVTALPFEDDSFDIASISFGIRNVRDPERGIAEMARVVRKGGWVMVLEFGSPRNTLLRGAYDAYRRRVLPLIGGAITGERDAYEYLDRSAAAFPHGQEFAALMHRSASFSAVDIIPLTFGIAWMYRGVKT